MQCSERVIKIAIQADDAGSNPDRLRLTAERMQILLSLRHPNLVKVFDIRPHEREYAMVVIEESVKAMSLEEKIRRSDHGRLREDQIRKYCRQICHALNNLHSVDNSFISRNISSASVMITEADEVKLLVDYNMTIQLQGVSSIPRSEQSRGLPHYMAPELLMVRDESCKYSRDSDIWAFGCLVYEMATGKRPYADCQNVIDIGKKILTHGAPSLHQRAGHSDALRSFYTDCVARERSGRKSAAALLEHGFLTQ